MYVPYRSRAKPGFYSIDGERVRCDSKIEATIIQKLSSHGFKDKWRRTRGGIAFGTAKATPDVELCILHDGMNRRALVEFKAFSVDEYPRNKRRDLYAVRRFYGDAIPLLYINKSDKWYIIEPTGALTSTPMPTPGGITIDQLPKPKFMIPIFNFYGRRYWTRSHTVIMQKTSDGLEFIVKSFFYSPKSTRKKRK